MNAIQPNGRVQENIELRTIPDTCPMCNKSGIMVRQPSAFVCFRGANSSLKTVQLTFRCPRHSCGSLFIAEYDLTRPFRSAEEPKWELCRLYPKVPVEPGLPDCISTISPSFKELYSQALRAEYHNLNQLFGLALRKALEFLIKDYCIYLDPDSEQDIKKEYLGTLIKNRVANSNIKTCAERATWLGNDETHYERRWAGHDVRDLDTLINLTINWIEQEVLTKSYLESMQGRQ